MQLWAQQVSALSHSLKKPIFFQDGEFFLFLSSLAIDHISCSSWLRTALSISLSCLCWYFKYSLYASSISSCVICCSPSSMYASSSSALRLWSGSWALSLLELSPGCVPVSFVAASIISNHSPSALRLLVVRGGFA